VNQTRDPERADQHCEGSGEARLKQQRSPRRPGLSQADNKELFVRSPNDFVLKSCPQHAGEAVSRATVPGQERLCGGRALPTHPNFSGFLDSQLALHQVAGSVAMVHTDDAQHLDLSVFGLELFGQDRGIRFPAG
jgi:hypothetical protein